LGNHPGAAEISAFCAVQRMAWKVHAGKDVNTTTNQIKAEWVKAGLQGKGRADQINQLIGRVRGIFVFLFVATIFVFSFNRHMEIQMYASAKISHAINHLSTASDRLRQNAVNYEKQVDDIAK